MQVRETRHSRNLLVEARIVLHRARAEREEAEVDCVILPRQARVVAHRFRFRETRKSNIAVPLESAEARRALRHFSEIDSRLLSIPDLEYQRLFEHQSAIAGDGMGLVSFVRGSRRAPARRIDRHRTTSFSAKS